LTGIASYAIRAHSASVVEQVERITGYATVTGLKYAADS
jgi:hypothetical protein